MTGFPHTLLGATFLATFLLAAGCLGQETGSPPAISTAYKDADQRFYNSVGGTTDETKHFEVALGKDKLTVKADYSCGGVCSFSLNDPSGHEKESIDSMGGHAAKDDSWYSTVNPTPGTWTLELQVSGGAEYAFGFYVEP